MNTILSDQRRHIGDRCGCRQFIGIRQAAEQMTQQSLAAAGAFCQGHRIDVRAGKFVCRQPCGEVPAVQQR